ncbi:MAG: phytanoyl-CoA dioxygenase family protein, partial [Armatimonadetes bacterium]|nr:phytanoyl-CoA dioxygenase family protein [Armatimonadota bacterium]
MGKTIALSSCHVPLDTSPARLGELRRSDGAVGDMDELRCRAVEDGYLFVPGFFNRDDVMAARLSVLRSLREEGALHSDRDWRDSIAAPGVDMAFRPDLANGNREVEALLYSPQVMAFFGGLLGEPAMHYDYTWLRAVGPGNYTEPHYDIVYMGRGSQRIYTMWVPMSRITYDVGGLMILEGSHRLDELKSTYGT